MNPLQDIFISYGRADSKRFAKQLTDRLEALGYSVWFDFDSIPQGVDYQKQIDDGIAKADNFVFIISPHATRSTHCRQEIERAVALNKRLIPLMHVEEISRGTWQQRYPDGKESDWDAYCGQGDHSCFTHMHAAIEKINWNQLDFSDDDNCAAAFQSLIELLQEERIYVRQHTELLNKALDWEQHQKQTQYLLIGEERQRAEKWLVKRFDHKQPPCIPTDLHCEFITESIKNANNLMTQVFLCHAEPDRTVADQVQLTLMRAGITTWTHHDDIEFGSDFQAAMLRGIEEADNVIFLLSPNSLDSRYCQQELNHALALHKRIIPMLISEVDVKKIPASIQSLQYINLADNVTLANYQQDESDLLRSLQQDAAYYNAHKVLLTKALKWQRQQYNPCILLRGYELQHAIAWLKLARQHPDHSSVSLQGEFINTSEQQPSSVALDVFVSYSRTDSDFARRLNQRLQQQRKRTWFDQESIASGADFQQEIYRGIEASDHFLFILSPSSVNSPYCADEVNYAAKLNKRIVTVRHCPVAIDNLHPELAKVQWIDFHGVDFNASFQELIRTLDADADHLNFHTSLLMQAIAWDKKQRRESLLLRGADLVEAEQWLLKSAGKQPQPTPLQGSYVASSRKASTNRQRTLVGWLSGLLAFAIAAGTAAIIQYRIAAQQRNIAQQKQQEAEIVATELLFLSNLNIEALINGIKTARQIDTRQQHPDNTLRVAASLRQIIYSIKEKNRLNAHIGSVWGIAHSPDGSILASGGKDKRVRLWQPDGTLIAELEGHTDVVWNVRFSPDGKTIASASNDGTVRLWQPDGTPITVLEGHTASVWEVRFSPNGKTIASASHDGTVKLWQLDGTLITTLKGHGAGVWDVNFSPDGNIIASASVDKTVRLWQRNGTSIAVLKGHEADVGDVIFSPDGQILASASGDGTVRLWQRNGTPIKTLKGHTGFVRAILFSPDGQTLVSAGDDSTVRLWQRDGTPIKTLLEHTNQVWNLGFSPDGKTIASASRDNTVRLWQLDGTPITTLAGHLDRIWSVSFSPDGKTLASASGDGTVRLWQYPGNVITQLQGHEQVVGDIRFSPDGNLLASASNDNTLRLWQKDGTLIANIEDHEDIVWDIRFSPDGQTIASASNDHTVRLWQRNGTPIATLKGHTEGVGNVRFSPDGQTIASASGDTTIKLWQLDGTLITTLKGHQSSVQKVVFSPEGKTLASASEDNTVRLWRRDGTLLTTMSGHQAGIRDVRFSPDGKTVASASKDNTIRLWQLDGTPVATLSGHTPSDYGVGNVQFSPDGKTLATGAGDGTVRLWQLNGTSIITLKGHTAAIKAMAFSPDGTVLATASTDQTIRLWQLDGKPIATLRGHRGSVEDVRFSPDGKILASASKDKTVILWNFDLDELVAKGCDWLGDYMTNIDTPEEHKELCPPQ